MSNSKKSTNVTHRKRLARRVAEASGMPYTQALEKVIAAAEAGLLPTPLEPAGMDAALTRLLALEAVAASGAPDSPVKAGQTQRDETRAALEAEALIYGRLVADLIAYRWGDLAASLRSVRVIDDRAEQIAWRVHDTGLRASLPGSDDAVQHGSALESHMTRLVHYWEYLASGYETQDARYLSEVRDDIAELQQVFASRSDRQPATATNTEEKVHKARPNEVGSHCAVCMQPVKRVPGGQGPTWVHTDTGFVAGSGGDPDHPLSEQAEDTHAADRARRPATVFVAHEGNPVPRCTASSWRSGPTKGDPAGYGPGGYNRCVKEVGHETADDRHVDEWGNEFLATPKFRLLRHRSQDEVAQIATAAGMVLLNPSGEPLPYASSTAPVGMQIGDLTPNLLVQTKTNEVLKVSTVYDENQVSAQVVYPVPPRTTVRFYSAADVATWKPVSDVMYGKYERAWGFRR